MAYKILSANVALNTHEFLVDSIEDLQELPQEPASTALVAATGDTYICNNVGKWVMYIDNPIGDGGSGGGAQSYPLTVGEDSRHIKITFRNSSTGDEITEAPAGAVVKIDCGSIKGNSGNVTCYTLDESFQVFEKSGYLGEYDIYTAVPIGGLTAVVYVD